MTPIELRPSTSTPRAASAARTQPAAAPDAAPQDNVQIDAAEPGKPQYVPGQVIVKFRSGVGAQDVGSLANANGLSVVKHFDMPKEMATRFNGELYQFKLRGGDTVASAVARLSGQKGVAYAEPNYRVSLGEQKPTPAAPPTKTDGAPNDLDPRVWGIHNSGQDGGTAGVDVGAVEAWSTTTGQANGQGPLICVIDTGIDYTHEDLAANAWTNPGEIAGDGIDNDGNGVIDDVHGANWTNGTGDPLDDHSHGSHCSGSIGAVGNNGKGVVGVNWNATIAGSKIFDGGGSTTDDAILNGIMYSAKIGARVTSNSWGGGPFSQAIHDAFQANPALHICAAGNNGSDIDASPFYPAGYDLDNIVSVAAIDRNGALADFSNYGATQVDVAAPGVDVFSTVPGGYGTMSGTSMATPHVTGVAGLILSKYPDLTNDELKARLVNTATHQDNLEGKVVSGGRVNAANALETDEIAPATPSDLTAEGSATALTLRFTATGDDGMEGRASAYQVRYSTSPIVDEAAWAQAIAVKGLPRPSEAGTQEALRIPIPPEEEAREYFVALRVVDNLGNASETVNTSAVSLPAAVPFKDDFESASDNWTTSGTWARVTDGDRGTVYTDSPDGAYGPNADSALTSRTIDLQGVKSPRLLFAERHNTEAGFDALHVEVSEDGTAWTELASYEGTSDWSDRNLDLTAFEGKQVQVRFRVTSDSSVEMDGAYVDNVRIAGEPA